MREHVQTLDAGSLWIEGEISNWSVPASGHAYFSLKDASAQLRCVMFRGSLQRTPYSPRNGDAVLVQGDIDIYEVRGEVQLIVRALAPAGAGLMQAHYEALRLRLLAEGLFDPARKRALPRMPRRIGLVTSATGAALQDIRTVIARRWPLARLQLTSCQVQGPTAAASIVAAIARQNAASEPADVLIVGRGGGSLEDLWAFNDESVVRAVAQSRIPTVSAVGHETDTTLCDFAADVRAPTPSAAAELVTPDALDLKLQLIALQRHNTRALSHAVSHLGHRLQESTYRLRHPRRHIESRMQWLDTLARSWHTGLQQRIELGQKRTEVLTARIAALSPLQVLARGYSIAQGPDGQTLGRASALPFATPFNLRFTDGVVRVHRHHDLP